MMFILLIIFAVLIFSIFNTTNIGFRKNEYSSNPMDILDKRFANGEISEEYYIKRRTILKDK